jgi:hypothetical protein
MDTISPVFRPNDRASFRDFPLARCLAFEFSNHSLDVREILLSTIIEAHQLLPSGSCFHPPCFVTVARSLCPNACKTDTPLSWPVSARKTRTREYRRRSHSMPATHDLPTLTMVHPTKQPLAPMLPAIVGNDQHRCARKHEQTDDHPHPRCTHGEPLLATSTAI